MTNQIIKPIKMGIAFFLVVSEFECLIVQIKSSNGTSVVISKISEMYAGNLSIIYIQNFAIRV